MYWNLYDKIASNVQILFICLPLKNILVIYA